MKQVDLMENYSDLPIWITDSNGIFTSVNKACCTLFNLPHTDIVGSSWDVLIRCKKKDMVVTEWRRALQFKKVYKQKFYMITGDDQVIPVLAQATPLNNRKGDVIKYVGQFVPINSEDPDSEVRLQSIDPDESNN